MTFEADLAGDDAVTLGMGASLTATDGAIADDRANDVEREFAPGGTGTERRRDFTVPPEAAPGEYVLSGALWDGEIGAATEGAVAEDSCEIDVRAASGLATIDCPTAGARLASEGSIVRGTADLERLADDQTLWLVVWSESPTGAGEVAWPNTEISEEDWVARDVTVGITEEPNTEVELRVYAFTDDQVDLVGERRQSGEEFLTDDEVPQEPQVRVPVIGAADSDLSPACSAAATPSTTVAPGPGDPGPDDMNLSMTCRGLQTQMQGGDQVDLDYQLTVSSTRQVGLGASLYEVDGDGAYWDDAHDVESVDVRPGQPPISRPFVIPVGTPAGTYRLAGEVFPGGEVGGPILLADAACDVIVTIID